MVLGIDIGLRAKDRPEQPKRHAQLVARREERAGGHACQAVERRGQPWHKPDGRKPMLGRGEDHLGRLPVEAVVQPALGQEAQQVAVRPKEDVQPALDPIAVGVAPSRNLAARHTPLF